MGFSTTLPLRPTQTATGTDGRQQNLRAALQAVSSDGPLSRADLARRTGLTAPTVSSLVADLLADGLVREIGQGASLGGKRPTLLAIDPDGRMVAALDLSRDPFEGVLVDLTGAVRDRVVSPVAGVSGKAAVEAVHDLVAELRGRATAPVAGIGIATPGLVDGAGTVVEASNLGWHDLPLGELVEERHGLAVWLANDADAAALAEFQALPPGEESVVAVRIGRGIGVGMVLGGRPYVGARWAAGEIGHLTVVPGGAPCACGSAGCLETVAGRAAIAQQLDVLTPGATPYERQPRDLEQAFREHDEVWVGHVLRQAGQALGAVLATLVAILDVPRIVVITDFGDVERHLLRGAAEVVRDRLSPAVAHDVTVLPSALGHDVVLHGAAVLGLSRAFGVVAP